MEVGSIWGHGSYVAPDWTADWLHREATFILDRWATAEFGSGLRRPARRAAGRSCARGSSELMRTNTYDPATRDADRRPGPRRGVRGQRSRTTPTSSRNGTRRVRHPRGRADRPGPAARQLAAFFFWTSWAGVHEPARATTITYTQQLAARAAGRQPAHRRHRRLDRRQHHPAAGRHRGDGLVVRRSQADEDDAAGCRQRDPLLVATPTPSQQATRQVLLGRRRR